MMPSFSAAGVVGMWFLPQLHNWLRERIAKNKGTAVKRKFVQDIYPVNIKRVFFASSIY